jgi:hypothetical protein
MARAALKTRDLPGRVAELDGKKQKRTRLTGRMTTLSGKVFESMTPPEKDLLLKALAVAAGLIDDSDDP